jgi:hypothetical protein
MPKPWPVEKRARSPVTVIRPDGTIAAIALFVFSNPFSALQELVNEVLEA